MNQRLVVVDGKGGVGRTTVAVALGRAWASRGRRVWVVSLHNDPGLARRCGVAPAYAPTPITPNVWVSTLATPAALRDFGTRKLPVGALGGAALGSRPMSALVDAVPGLADLVQLGKVEDRLRWPIGDEVPLDAIILDAPATGHGHRLLDAPGVVAALARTGPFHGLAAKIADLIGDEQTLRQVVVSLPEPLPASETLESIDATLAAGRRPHAIVMNRTPPRPPQPRPDLPPGWNARMDLLEARVALADAANDTLRTGLAARRLDHLPQLPMADAAAADGHPPWGAWADALAPLVDALEAS